MASSQSNYDLLLDSAIEERADFLPESELKGSTVKGDLFDSVHAALTAKGTKLIVGPRGCGKTHMMRYAWIECRDNDESPLAVFVSFNKYFRLEPLLTTNTNAIELFHTWVLARIILATNELSAELGKKHYIATIEKFSSEALQSIISRLERGIALNEAQLELSAEINIESTKAIIDTASETFKRKRTVVLLDDAALTLTPEFLYEFFDIVRSLKSNSIALKASVYPGTTEYGPRFHVHHEAETINVWLSVEDQNYQQFMEDIGNRRFQGYQEFPVELRDIFKYVAFGVPRAFLMLLREYQRDGTALSQKRLNRVVEEHYNTRISEYNSLALKIPKFATLINKGYELFKRAIEDLKVANSDLSHRNEKQIIVGVDESDFDKPFIERMFNLLIEAGLIYELSSVSHGADRTYRRYTPHMAALIAARAFSGGSRGTAVRQVVDNIQLRSTKHPLRRSVKSLLSKEALNSLSLDLPACEKCKTPRINETQKFCHQCGSELIDRSTYSQCMTLPIIDVPGLTEWQRSRIGELDSLKSIGDLLSKQDPGTELRKIRQVGHVRATKIQEAVQIFVDEFLS